MSDSISEVLKFSPFESEMSEVTQKRKFHLQTFKLRYLIGQNHEAIPKLPSLYKIHLFLACKLVEVVNESSKFCYLLLENGVVFYEGTFYYFEVKKATNKT